MSEREVSIQLSVPRPRSLADQNSPLELRLCLWVWIDGDLGLCSVLVF